jgi:multidrug transporter EmrE-like cation transporter
MSAPMKGSLTSWICVALTVTLTIYGQIVVKWQVTRWGRLPAGAHEKVVFFVKFFTSPWIVSVILATGFAALCWVAALSHLELSRAYPFTALSFVIVLLLSTAFFGEPLTPAKIVGVGLVVTGLVIGVSL